MSGRSDLAVLRDLKSIKAIREWLGMSLTEMGLAMQVSRTTVADWQSGKNKITELKLRGIGQLVVDRLAKLIGRNDIGLEIEANSPIKISIKARCKVCKEWFDLHHAGTRRCEACRRPSPRPSPTGRG